MSDTSKAQPALLPTTVTVDFPGRDRVVATRRDQAWDLAIVGCVALEDQLRDRLRAQNDVTLWSLPKATSHVDLLIRELILRARGEWQLPYLEDELCHCRSVPTAIVDQAILAGAHDCKQVSSETSASTSCGTCRPYVQQIIDYRLRSKVG